MNKNSRQLIIAVQLLIFAAVFTVFLPPTDPMPTMVSDDTVYISQGARLDLSWENIVFYFKTPVLFLHSPLVMFSFMVDKLVWGKQLIYGVHVVNALLHAISSVLFFCLLRNLHFYRKGKTSLRIDVITAAITVLLWSLHPQRAESVAWACERKDTLTVFLFLCCAVSFVRSFRKGKYDIPGVVPYALSFLCKPMLITFPVLAAIFIFCETRGKNFWKKLKYIIPYAAAAAGYFLINLTQIGNSAGNHSCKSFSELLDAAANVGRYFQKTLFPSGLCTHYSAELPAADVLWLAVLLIPVLLLKSKWKNFSLYCILPCAAMFAISVFPVSGIISIGSTSFADRYSYLPSLFIAAGTAFIIAAAADKWKKSMLPIGIICAIILLFFITD